MKRVKHIICLSMLIFLLVCLAACSSSLYTIDFVVDGQIYHTTYVREGESVKFPKPPKKESCRFDDWYLEETEFETAFNDNYLKENKITSSMTAYARWIVLETIGLKYELLGDDTYEVTGYIGDGLDIVIPAQHNGKKVTAIGQEAFSGLSRIRTIIIPPSVSKISPSAFNRLVATIEFSNDGNLKDIGSYAFDNYKGQKIVIPDSVTTIDPYAFYNAVNLETVVLPTNLEYIGSYAFYNCTELSDITLPKGLKEIGEYAFSGCASIYYLEIPKSVVNIEKYAFSNVVGSVQFAVDTQIKELSDYAFANYKGSGIKIPSSVTKIYDNTFYNCAKLKAFEVAQDNKSFKEIDGVLYDKTGTELLQYPIQKETDETNTFVVPSSVTKIGAYAFSHAVVNVAFSQNTKIAKIDNNAFNNYRGYSITLPSSVKTLGKASFANCPSLSNFVIPSSVEQIGEGAFSYSKGNIVFDQNSGITAINTYAFENYKGDQISIPSSVVSIDAYAFSGCDNLKSVIIPQGVAIISSYAFYNCTSLTSITMPDSLQNIGSYAFYNCIGLTEITIPKNVVTIGTNVFTNVSAKIDFALDSVIKSIGSGAFSHYKGEQITLSDSIMEIQSSAFYSCSNLLNINLPDSLTYIGDRAFYNCTNIFELTIPKNVVNLGSLAFSFVTGKVSFSEDTEINAISSGAFANYRGAELIIPNTVIALGAAAFSNCTNLTGITIPSSVVSIGDKAFSNVIASIAFAKDIGITTLGAGAFTDYKGTSLTIPASVRQIGERVFYGCTNLAHLKVESDNPWFTTIDGVLYNSDITALVQYPVKREANEFVIPESVSSLYSYSFAQNMLENITISKNVSSIGAYAFIDTSANLVFESDSSLSIISSLVFYGYKGEQLELPDSVSQIEQSAFANCQNLTKILINNDNYTSIDGVLYNREVTNLLQYPVGKKDDTFNVPLSVTQIYQSAFSGNGYVAKVNIPQSVMEIGDNAFYNCNNLASVDVNSNNANYMTKDGILYNKDGDDLIHYPSNKKDAVFVVPDNVKRILPYAFKGCNNLISIVFSNQSKLTTLQDHAFRGCNNLSKVDFGNNSMLSAIGAYAFYGCSNLTSINIPDSVQKIGQWSFEGCSSLQYEIVDDNLKYLGDWLIYVEDKTVAEINLKSTTIGIGPHAFKYLANLTSIILPSAVKIVGNGAFEYCTALESVEILSASIIETLAFNGCALLKELTIYGLPPQLGRDAFKNTSLTKIYVEEHLVDVYKSSQGFESHAHIIFAKPAN
ncbi:MAG: leucine-rich repeat protein [Clostridiales bacterium]|nr:leucine-rich repeat protein [Clostridiales bacterium]